LGSGLLFIAMLFTAGAVSSGLVLATSVFPQAGVWSFGRRVGFTLLTTYAMRMAAVFAISTPTIATRLGFAPRWITFLGLACGVVLLLTAGVIPWIEVIFPAWVFTFSIHILGLEVLIIADIVQTITIDPTLESAVALALIVVVRTFLSFSLEIELDGVVPWRKHHPARSDDRSPV
jgi:hypothetical protein